MALLHGERETQLELAVLRGSADIFTPQGSTPVRAGQRAYASEGLAPSFAYAFNSAMLDEFDQWIENQHGAQRGISAQYLAPEVQSYAPVLDAEGDWRYNQPYGYVWYPRVATGWRPYYYGRWLSVPPVRLDVGGQRSLRMAHASLRSLGLLVRRLVLDSGIALGACLRVVGVRAGLRELVPAGLRQPRGVRAQRQYRSSVRSSTTRPGTTGPLSPRRTSVTATSTNASSTWIACLPHRAVRCSSRARPRRRIAGSRSREVRARSRGPVRGESRHARALAPGRDRQSGPVAATATISCATAIARTTRSSVNQSDLFRYRHRSGTAAPDDRLLRDPAPVRDEHERAAGSPAKRWLGADVSEPTVSRDSRHEHESRHQQHHSRDTARRRAGSRHASDRLFDRSARRARQRPDVLDSSGTRRHDCPAQDRVAVAGASRA